MLPRPSRKGTTSIDLVRTFGSADPKPEVRTIDVVGAAPSSVPAPIRAEVFGIERLMQHAGSLAAAQPTAHERARGRLLLPRVRENGKVLLAGYRDIIEVVRQKRQITQAEEWLLDNFHVVDGQIREIRDHLPRSFYDRLPKLAEGYHLGGYPRVYGLAWAYVAHTDSRFDLETLQAFVRAYQRIHPLGIGELWAVAIHLRVALVENLRRLSELIIRARQARAHAADVADRLLGFGDQPAERMEDVLGLLGNGPFDSSSPCSSCSGCVTSQRRSRLPSTGLVTLWLHRGRPRRK